jgi:hypothetical protein
MKTPGSPYPGGADFFGRASGNQGQAPAKVAKRRGKAGEALPVISSPFGCPKFFSEIEIPIRFFLFPNAPGS